MSQYAVGWCQSGTTVAVIWFLRLRGLWNSTSDGDDVCRAEVCRKVSHIADETPWMALWGVQALQRCAVPQLSSLLLCVANGEFKSEPFLRNFAAFIETEHDDDAHKNEKHKNNDEDFHELHYVWINKTNLLEQHAVKHSLSGWQHDNEVFQRASNGGALRHWFVMQKWLCLCNNYTLNLMRELAERFLCLAEFNFVYYPKKV